MDKELLLKPRLTECEVELEGVGVVRVRALTRDEVLRIRDEHRNNDGDYDLLGLDNAMVAAGMVNPVLTEAEVEQWASVTAAGEVTKVALAIQEISGLTEGAAKSGVPRDRSGRGTPVRNGTRRKTR